jgi:hypothetical protein
MEFDSSVVQEAWRRAGSRCECRAPAHAHGEELCKAQLGFPSRGKEGQWGWEARPIQQEGPQTAENCQIVCAAC